MKDDQFSCVDVANRLHGYVDAMLEPAERAAVDRHLDGCARCSAELANLRDVEARLARLFRESPAPPEDLWERVRPATNPGRVASAGAGFGGWQRAAAAAAAVVVVAIAALAPTGVVQRFASRDARLEVALVQAPREELRAFVDSRRRVDLASGDLWSLHEWFAGKIDFALPAPTTRPEIRLVGARLCFFLDRRVASLMYQADGRTLSLYVIPADSAALDAHATRTVDGEPVVVSAARGYAQVTWRRGALVHALAADLPAERLLELSRDFVASTRPAPREAGFLLLAQTDRGAWREPAFAVTAPR